METGMVIQQGKAQSSWLAIVLGWVVIWYFGWTHSVRHLLAHLWVGLAWQSWPTSFGLHRLLQRLWRRSWSRWFALQPEIPQKAWIRIHISGGSCVPDFSQHLCAFSKSWGCCCVAWGGKPGLSSMACFFAVSWTRQAWPGFFSGDFPNRGCSEALFPRFSLFWSPPISPRKPPPKRNPNLSSKKSTRVFGPPKDTFSERGL